MTPDRVIVQFDHCRDFVIPICEEFIEHCAGRRPVSQGMAAAAVRDSGYGRRWKERDIDGGTRCQIYSTRRGHLLSVAVGGLNISITGGYLPAASTVPGAVGTYRRPSDRARTA